eukprot:4045819-Pyramimonas_sp.AAC.1
MQLSELSAKGGPSAQNLEEVPIAEPSAPAPVLGTSPNLCGQITADVHAGTSPVAEGSARAENRG